MVSKEFVKDNFYFMDEELIFFNHGTYGICPKPVLEEKIKILRKFEENPVIGFAETMFDGCLENTKILAGRLGVSFKNLVVVSNVTSGLCSIFQSIESSYDHEILLTNFTYQAVRMGVEEYLVKKGLIIKTLNLELPFQSNEEICNLYKNFVLNNPKIKFAIIDHIPSGLSLVQPIKDIIKTLRHLGVFVIIDGAHAPGQIKDFNILDFDADIYIGNLHKWCFLPRGTAFIVLRENSSINLRDNVVSFLHERELYLRFIYTGTNDISNALCIKSAFNFIDMLGGFETIYSIITEILNKGISHLEVRWNVTTLSFPEVAPYTRLVPLPAGFMKYKDMILMAISEPFQRKYYSYTLRKLKFIAAIVLIEEKLYFRLCCHIYNTFDHFVQFSERVLRWLEFFDNGETFEDIELKSSNEKSDLHSEIFLQ